jgi:hypothetical protein
VAALAGFLAPFNLAMAAGAPLAGLVFPLASLSAGTLQANAATNWQPWSDPLFAALGRMAGAGNEPSLLSSVASRLLFSQMASESLDGLNLDELISDPDVSGCVVQQPLRYIRASQDHAGRLAVSVPEAEAPCNPAALDRLFALAAGETEVQGDDE